MCHGSFGSDAWLRAAIADELLDDERAEEAVEAAGDDGVPGFLNEERDADVELLTDGGGE